MPLDYNNVYLIGAKRTDGTGWLIDQKPFTSEKDANDEAESRTIKSGFSHFVFKAITYYSQDEITASKSYFA